MFSNYTKQERNFYLLLVFLWTCGILVLFSGIYFKTIELCPVKALSGYPCPGCGTGHGILEIVSLHFGEAWELNPFSFLIFPFLVIVAPLLVFDIITNARHLHQLYLKIEKILSQHTWLSILLISLILIHWIYKLYLH